MAPNKKPKIIAFDFDGVIGDSVYECYVQSIKAFKDVGGKLEDTPEVERAYRKARPFVKVAEDYDVVLRMIEKNPDIDFDRVTQVEFNQVKGEYTADFKTFKEKFLAYRKEMQKSDMDAWYNLQAQFPYVGPGIRELQKKYKVVIATTKDRASTAKLLQQYGVNIPEEDIISKDIIDDKAKQIQFIAIKYEVPVKNITLVDDMIEQLKPVKKTGARVAMANWGYSTAGQRAEAQKKGIPLLEPAKLPRQLKKSVDPFSWHSQDTVTQVLLIILTILLLLMFARILS